MQTFRRNRRRSSLTHLQIVAKHEETANAKGDEHDDEYKQVGCNVRGGFHEGGADARDAGGNGDVSDACHDAASHTSHVTRHSHTSHVTLHTTHLNSFSHITSALMAFMILKVSRESAVDSRRGVDTGVGEG